MKRLATALALLAAPAAFLPLHAATLDAKTWTIELTPLCGESVPDCEQFAFAGTQKISRSQLNMTGKPAVRSCALPCDPNGFQFYDGSTGYFVGRDGWLIVTTPRKQPVRELGVWRN
jgi:hypothetical protein